MKIFTATQVKTIDKYTIDNEPVHSISLMERAAEAFVTKFCELVKPDKNIHVFAGPGNNGGDALAISRLLKKRFYRITVYIANFGKQPSPDNQINYNRLSDIDYIEIIELKPEQQLPEIQIDDIVIDGLFGYGLDRPLSGFAANIIQHINSSGATIFSIDIPSGLKAEDNSDTPRNNIIQADYTLTFEFPFLSFFFPENEIFTGKWEILKINLHEDIIQKTETPYYLVFKQDIIPLIFSRNKFTHKGNFGHALLISGSYGKTGAAVLSSKACLRAGTGLLTALVPKTGFEIMQTAVPEAMLFIQPEGQLHPNENDFEKFSAIGIGPGIGKTDEMHKLVNKLLSITEMPMVIDADALNILSEHPDWYDKLPQHCILTPHPKEFERLAGKWNNSFERLNKQIDFAKRYNVFVILKGAYSSIACPDGTVLFNSTGNPGMATAGSGDVLTGIILGLLSQGYPADEAAVIGVYLHGLAGDLAAADISQEALIASDITNYLGKAFQCLKK